VKFVFEGRPSDSAFVETIWRTESEGGGSFTSVAESHWGIVITRQVGRTYLTVRGPETKAIPAPVPVDAEFFGIGFKLGTFMPHLPARMFVDTETNLPGATSKSFWLQGAAWEFPNFDNADTFVDRLVRQGLLVRDPIVEAVLNDRDPALSIRSVRRRFLQATGLTYKSIRQIERARQALTRLQQGASILDTVHELGYFDQPHLTRSLKHYMGQTPAQILRVESAIQF
jgi:AraC-like DNA-binding protein